jgi:hypothetical protein
MREILYQQLTPRHDSTRHHILDIVFRSPTFTSTVIPHFITFILQMAQFPIRTQRRPRVMNFDRSSNTGTIGLFPGQLVDPVGASSSGAFLNQSEYEAHFPSPRLGDFHSPTKTIQQPSLIPLTRSHNSSGQQLPSHRAYRQTPTEPKVEGEKCRRSCELSLPTWSSLGEEMLRCMVRRGIQ